MNLSSKLIILFSEKEDLFVKSALIKQLKNKLEITIIDWFQHWTTSEKLNLLKCLIKIGAKAAGS